MGCMSVFEEGLLLHQLRQAKMKSGAMVLTTFHPDAAAVGINDALDDGQAQNEAAPLDLLVRLRDTIIPICPQKWHRLSSLCCKD
jgi:hypothetical protein